MLNNFTNTVCRKTVISGVSILLLSVPALSMARPAEVRLSALEQCRFLGKVEGSSGYGRQFDGLNHAKSSAVARAEKLGASHIVWERIVPVGVYNGHAVARVYHCDRALGMR